MTADDIVLKLKKQNDLPLSADISVIRTRINENWTYNRLVAVLETDQTFEILNKLKIVNVEWDPCRVGEEVNAASNVRIMAMELSLAMVHSAARGLTEITK